MVRVVLLANTREESMQLLDEIYAANSEDVAFRYKTLLKFKDGSTIDACSKNLIGSYNATYFDQVFVANNLEYTYNIVAAIATISSRTSIPDGYVVVKLDK